MKKKVCVVITARPSYSRIKTALRAIQNHPELELQLVVAASALLSKHGSTINLIERDGFFINARVHMVLDGDDITMMAKTTGIGIIELSTVLNNLQPDIVVTIADRFETMATAVAASYMNIPLVHVQGGEVTGNIDEKVRHAITKLADIHLVSSTDAKDRLLKMGEFDNKIFVTGCPSIDLAKEVKDDPELDFNPFEKYGGVGNEFSISNGYLVVLQHPVTTEFNQSLIQITATLEAVKKLEIPTFWFWPNIDAGSDATSKGIRRFREKYELKNMHFFKNMEGKDFLKLIFNAKCLIGNSSVGIRECSYLGVPVVNIGTRQNRRLRGRNVIDVNHSVEEIVNAVRAHNDKPRICEENLYGDGTAGKKIADAIADSIISVDKVISY